MLKAGISEDDHSELNENKMAPPVGQDVQPPVEQNNNVQEQQQPPSDQMNQPEELGQPESIEPVDPSLHAAKPGSILPPEQSAPEEEGLGQQPMMEPEQPVLLLDPVKVNTYQQVSSC